MQEEVIDRLNAKDLTVLQAVRDGCEDVFEITRATTLSNREVNYSLDEKSLADMGLVELSRPDGRVVREVDGEMRSFQAPKRVALTGKGVDVLDTVDDVERYRGMEWGELVERVRDLENRMDRLENGFATFRRQVMEKLDGPD